MNTPVSALTILVCSIVYGVIPTAASAAATYWSLTSGITPSDFSFTALGVVAYSAAIVVSAVALRVFSKSANYLNSLIGYLAASGVLSAALFAINVPIGNPILWVVATFKDFGLIFVGVVLGSKLHADAQHAQLGWRE